MSHVLFLYPHPPFRSDFYPIKGRHSASLPLNISSPSVQLPFPFIFPHTTAVSDSFKRNTLGSASLSSATAFKVNFPSKIPLAWPLILIQKPPASLTGNSGHFVDVSLKLPFFV